MPIKFRCEHCRQLLGISTSKAGQIVDCPTCGRAVSVPDLEGKSAPVPPPQLDLQDHSLLNALEALAQLGLPGQAVAPPTRSEADKSRTAAIVPEKSSIAIELPPAPKPVPIELPALQKPVAIAEAVPLNESNAEMATVPDKSPEPTSQTVESPLDKLAEIARGPKPDKATVVQHAVPVPMPRNGGSNSFLSLAFVALLSFAIGFLVHAQFFNSARESSPEVTGDPVDSTPDSVSPKKAIQLPVSNSTAVRGRITFRTPDGTSQPDSGACVILLPENRTGSAKLSITGFRPADAEADRELARASIRALGGELAVVDESGNFSATLAQSGRYHVVVLSHFQPRPTGQPDLTPAERTILASYFDRPDQLAGKLRYEMAQLVYRGEASETWDYSFERI